MHYNVFVYKANDALEKDNSHFASGYLRPWNTYPFKRE